MACLFLNLTDSNATNPRTSDNNNNIIIHGNSTSSSGSERSWSRANPKTLEYVLENFILTKLFLVVCVIGLVGNVLNLVVLSQKALTFKMGRMERSVYSGLIGLAASDMLICIAVLPNVYIGTGTFHYYSYDFRLLYSVYENAVVNTFLLTSTWLTVTMATSRYVAVCYPLKARQLIGKRFAVTSLIVVFVVCTLFNVPRYLRHRVMTYDCPDGTKIYFSAPGRLRRGGSFDRVYQYVYFITGIFIPLLILAVCNVQLIRAMRRAVYVRKASRATQYNSRAANRLTLTLVVIVVMYIVLFIPGEIVSFLKEIKTQVTTDVYNLIVAVLNLLQAINFACNFVLYSAINTHFRRTVYQLVCCLRRRDEAKHGAASSNNSRLYGSVTGASTYV